MESPLKTRSLQRITYTENLLKSISIFIHFDIVFLVQEYIEKFLIKLIYKEFWIQTPQYMIYFYVIEIKMFVTCAIFAVLYPY